MKWVEARLGKGEQPGGIYDWLPRRPEVAHHFFDEPWWPGRYVVRLRTDVDVSECPAVQEVVDWDDEPDAEAFGDYWPWAQTFFEASSMLSLRGEDPHQLVHCTLNAHAINGWREVRWMFAFAIRRAILPFRWRLYLKRRWEQAGGAPVKEEPCA